MKQKGSDYFTKDDGKKLETDLTKKLSVMIDTKINFKIDEKLNEIRDDMKQWHSDILDIVDGLASEVKNNRDFRDVTTNQIVEVGGRVGKLEKKVFGVSTS